MKRTVPRYFPSSISSSRTTPERTSCLDGDHLRGTRDKSVRSPPLGDTIDQHRAIHGALPFGPPSGAGRVSSSRSRCDCVLDFSLRALLPPGVDLCQSRSRLAGKIDHVRLEKGNTPRKHTLPQFHVAARCCPTGSTVRRIMLLFFLFFLLCFLWVVFSDLSL